MQCGSRASVLLRGRLSIVRVQWEEEVLFGGYWLAGTGWWVLVGGHWLVGTVLLSSVTCAVRYRVTQDLGLE